MVDITPTQETPLVDTPTNQASIQDRIKYWWQRRGLLFMPLHERHWMASFRSKQDLVVVVSAVGTIVPSIGRFLAASGAAANFIVAVRFSSGLKIMLGLVLVMTNKALMYCQISKGQHYIVTEQLILVNLILQIVLSAVSLMSVDIVGLFSSISDCNNATMQAAVVDQGQIIDEANDMDRSLLYILAVVTTCTWEFILQPVIILPLQGVRLRSVTHFSLFLSAAFVVAIAAGQNAATSVQNSLIQVMFGFLLFSAWPLFGTTLLQVERANRHAYEKVVELARVSRQLVIAEQENIAITCHEVRNPLNGSIGYLRLANSLLEEVPPTNEDTRGYSANDAVLREYAFKGLACTELALSVLNSMNSLSRIRSGHHTPTMRWIALVADVIRPAAHVLTPQLQEGVMLRTALPEGGTAMVLESDAALLVQILTNVGQNAARFTKCGYIEIGCSLLEAIDGGNGDATVRFFVRDTGCGMSPTVRDSVFDRFTTSGGTGLGMYIVKQSVELLAAVHSGSGDGVLTATSPWSSTCESCVTGSEISFELIMQVRVTGEAAISAAPAAAAPACTTVAPPKALQAETAEDAAAVRARATIEMESADLSPPPLHVLVGDDMKMNRQLLSMSLKHKCCLGPGIEVDLAESGEEALSKCFPGTGETACAYDIVFLDEHMSDEPESMLGSQVVRAVRAREQTIGTSTRAVLVSCSGDGAETDFIAMVKEAGADAVWCKPFPNAVNGDMKRELLKLLHAAGKACSGNTHNVHQEP